MKASATKRWGGPRYCPYAVSMSDSDISSAVDLNKFQINTKKGLKEFLRVIHSGFLDVVDPRRSRILDIMIQNELLTESDQESLSGKGVYVRRDQARKLWFCLHKIRVQDFTSVVLPELCSTFPHILPAEWTDDNQDDPQDCFRHDIMEKIRPATMADRLFDCGCLSFEDYKDIMETQIRQEEMWAMLFEALRFKTTEVTEQSVRGLLEKRKVEVSDNFLEVLQGGVPCTCGRGQGLLTTAGQAAPAEKITTWLMNVRTREESTAYSDSVSMIQDVGSIQDDPLPDECFRFLLLGSRGSGKSKTGNTIIGEKLFKASASHASVTMDCERKIRDQGSRKIEIIDSPGLYNMYKTQDESYTTILKAVVGMNPGLHAILYVVRVDPRYTAADCVDYELLSAVFDDSIFKYMIVLFTHGDWLDQKRISIEDFLNKRASKELQQLLRECNNRYIVFNNMAHDKQPQVERLLSMVRHMVAQNGGQPYSCPEYARVGQGMEEAVARRLLEARRRGLQWQTEETCRLVQELAKRMIEK